MTRAWLVAALVALSSLLATPRPAHAQPAGARAVPAPADVLGHTPGDDFYLASYDDALRYMHALDAASDRVRMVPVGKTSRGLDWEIALISSPRNLANLDRQVDIARQLAWARGLDDDAARALAREGRVIVHIDGGLHATEAACAQHTLVLAHRLASAEDDPEVDAILDNVILELWFSINPDGQNQVAAWYRKYLGTPYEVSPMPELYQEYIGHDNNRDGYMNNMVESRVVTRVTLQYNPQVYYNHHQTAPFPARIWIPPFAEPISSNVHPLTARFVSLFGTTMAAYLDEHGMPGAIHRGKGFDNWYPGFIDNVNSYRNTVAFLTETALFEYATPHFYSVSDFPRDRRDLRSEVFYASPWKGGWWRIGDAVRYMVGASMSVLDTAARYRETILFNRYQAGRDVVRRFHEEPPFAYVLPMSGAGSQPDPTAAAALVDVLRTNGIEVHRAGAPFKANGIEYAAGDLVVLMDQPFAALVKELFEVQEYPDLRDYSGGPPDLPYDVAGWTLPLQMGVETDAVMQPLDAATRATFVPLDDDPKPAGGAFGTATGAYSLPASDSGTYRLLDAVFRANGRVRGAGDAFIVSGVGAERMDALAREAHVRVDAVDAPQEPAAPAGTAKPMDLTPARVGLLRPWAPSIDEGWTRWLFERFGIPYRGLRNEDVRAGRLRERLDVIVLPDVGARTLKNGFAKGSVPPEYAGGLGDEGVDQLRAFVHGGGTVVAFNDAARFLATEFSLPVKDVVADLERTAFFCGGSLLRAEVKCPSHPVLRGCGDEITLMYEGSPVFEPGEGFQGNVLLAYPEDRDPLRSGFLLGAKHIQGKPALLDVAFGDGRIVLFGFRPQWRGQSYATFKLVFNALLYRAEMAPPPDPAPKATEPEGDGSDAKGGESPARGTRGRRRATEGGDEDAGR